MKERNFLKSERIKQFESTPVASYISLESFNWLVNESDFFTAPASTKYHGNYEGGLFDHSFIVMNVLADLTKQNNLVWQREESPYIIGLFHDLCKVNQYKPTPDGEFPYEYYKDCMLAGHGDKSVMVASTLLQIIEEEMYCIRYHMGAFVEKDEWNYYTRAVSKYPNVLWMHHADMISTHVCGT